MIVVSIIGILLAVAVPAFQKAGLKSRASTCVQNLKQLHGAKERWAMDYNQGPLDTPSMTDLAGPDTYLKVTPLCPTGGTYTLGNMNTVPVCSIGGTAGTPEGHVLP